jgi:hypothetical protein
MGKGKIVKMENQVEENVVSNEEEVKEFTPLTSKDLENLTDDELQAKLEELNAEQLEYARHMNSKMYVVNIESQSNLSLLKKWVEKEVRWNHKTVPTLVAMYDGLKKALEAGVDEDGNAHLSSIVVANIYQYLLTFEGVGFIDAKKYLTLLTKVGGPISEAMKQLADDQQHFRNIHSDMATVDQVQEARKHGIKVEDTSEMVAETPSEEA